MKKILLLLSVLFVVSCSKGAEDVPCESLPTMGQTKLVKTDIIQKEYAQITVSGNISLPTCDPSVISQGFVLDVEQFPTINKTKKIASGTSIQSTFEGLLTNTTYYVRTFFTNIEGNYYGAQLEIKTPKRKFTLTVSVQGEGTVTQKIIKAGSATDYTLDTVVELTAVPKDGWEFYKWDTSSSGFNDYFKNPAEIIIDRDRDIKAFFRDLSYPFYVADNGVTILPRDWVDIGTQGKAQENGTTYTLVDEDLLKSYIESNQFENKVVTTFITDMSSMFKGDPNFEPFDMAFGSWDVSNVTNMSSMFEGNFRMKADISNWDVSKVTNMDAMFHNASSFGTQAHFSNLNKWCVTNITSEPPNFADGSGLSSSTKPIWGTCPD